MASQRKAEGPRNETRKTNAKDYMPDPRLYFKNGTAFPVPLQREVGEIIIFPAS
jgi:hypothetical protein